MRIQEIDRRLGRFNQEHRPYRASYERPFSGRGGGANLLILVVRGRSVARSGIVKTNHMQPQELADRLHNLKLMAEREPEEMPPEEGINPEHFS